MLDDTIKIQEARINDPDTKTFVMRLSSGPCGV